MNEKKWSVEIVIDEHDADEGVGIAGSEPGLCPGLGSALVGVVFVDDDLHGPLLLVHVHRPPFGVDAVSRPRCGSRVWGVPRSRGHDHPRIGCLRAQPEDGAKPVGYRIGQGGEIRDGIGVGVDPDTAS